jgi:hypothetical protein
VTIGRLLLRGSICTMPQALCGSLAGVLFRPEQRSSGRAEAEVRWSRSKRFCALLLRSPPMRLGTVGRLHSRCTNASPRSIQRWERVKCGEWTAVCRELALLSVVVECVVQAGRRRPMTKWDGSRLNSMARIVRLAAAGVCTSVRGRWLDILNTEIMIVVGLAHFELLLQP